MRSLESYEGNRHELRPRPIDRKNVDSLLIVQMMKFIPDGVT